MLRKSMALVLLGLAWCGAGAVERVERGNLVLENVPEIPAEITTRLEQYQNTRSANFGSWLHGGSMLIATRFGDTNQVHRVHEPLGGRGHGDLLPRVVQRLGVNRPDLPGSFPAELTHDADQTGLC